MHEIFLKLYSSIETLKTGSSYTSYNQTIFIPSDLCTLIVHFSLDGEGSVNFCGTLTNYLQIYTFSFFFFSNRLLEWAKTVRHPYCRDRT